MDDTTETVSTDRLERVTLTTNGGRDGRGLTHVVFLTTEKAEELFSPSGKEQVTMVSDGGVGGEGRFKVMDLDRAETQALFDKALGDRTL